ncbi:MAG: DEAD/DEAH box helicase [Planctomycetota bacterium]
MTVESESPPAPDNGDEVASVLFSDLALPEPLQAALAEDAYTEPSPIQAAIIPHLLDGRDVIGQAQTGTGKTAAFALPILAQLTSDRAAGVKQVKGPTALVLAPTRELAIQVADAFGKYGRRLDNVRTLAVYGGADYRGQAVPLQRGVDVVVGTPGRVMDHMRRGTLDVSKIRTLVLDEADEMLRMGFVEDVEWVLSETPAGRQVALFSATMPSEIKAIAEKQLQNPERVRIKGVSNSADTVRQRYWRVQGVRKVEALCRLLAAEPVDAAIVFVRTRAATSELARALEDAGFPAAALSGDVPQAQRERTIEALRRGRLKLVVATDVAARGIDVKSISHVFNFDVPEDTEVYIHRIGRTGRAGRTGEAVLFVENRQRRLLQNIERATGHPIEKMELPTAAQVHALQLERFGNRLKERLTRKAKGDDKPEPAALRGFIEQICAETGRDAADVAAFLVGPAMNAVMGGGTNRPEDSRGNASDSAREQERPSRRDRGDRPAPRKPMGGASEKYRVAVGRADGVRAGHLVGAIANETGLDGQDINAVRIFDSYSTLELPAEMPGSVFEILQRTTVLGKPLRIRRDHARGESGSYGKPSHRPSGPPRHSMNTEAQKHRPRGTPDALPPTDQGAAASDGKPRFKAKFKLNSGSGRPKFAAKTKLKDKPKARDKFKAQATTHPKASANGKPTKNFKAVGKPTKPNGLAGAKPKAKSKSGGKPSGGHSLTPAPFAGGKQKPRRPNKRARPKS